MAFCVCIEIKRLQLLFSVKLYMFKHWMSDKIIVSCEFKYAAKLFWVKNVHIISYGMTKLVAS